MANKLCRLYGVTTLDGLKAICNNEPTAGSVNRLGITQITKEVLGFSTVSIDYYSLARKIISVLKEFEYYEYIVVAADGLTIIDTGFSDSYNNYLTAKTVVTVVDDDHDLVLPVPLSNLMELGVHDAPIPVDNPTGMKWSDIDGVRDEPIPAMFKLVNNADDCVESAEVIDLTKE